jgi:lysophospholipase L1-like esterase
MRRIAAAIAVATAVATVAMGGAAPALAAQRTQTTTHTYYLSLGDSLAQGVQPNSSGESVETNEGYPNQLYTALKQTNPDLKLVKLGCPGETTASMISGGICTYSKGSQLKQAVAFLARHRGQVQLVTIDIGANDLNPCVVLPTLKQIAECLAKVLPQTVTNLTKIMTALTTADGSGPVPTIIGMNYYVPELAEWLEGTTSARAIARASATLGLAFGNELSTVYTDFGAKVADVYDAFHSSHFKPMVSTPAFGTIPLNVAYVCSLTWECAPPPVGPNEHANILGYGVIANTFLETYLGT